MILHNPADLGRVLTLLALPMPIPESEKDVTNSHSLGERTALPLDVLPLGIAVADGEGRILQVNAEASRLLGLSASDYEQLSLRSPHWKLVRSDGSPVLVDDLPWFRALREQTRIDESELGVLRPDREFVWLNMTAVPMDLDRVLITYTDITENHRSRTILAATARLAEAAPELTMEQILQRTLDEAEALSGSCIGFYHFVDEDQENLHLQAWSTRTEAAFSRAEGKGSHYPVSQAGIWADSLRSGRPTIHNDHASLPNRKGLPPGHGMVWRELVVPVLRGGRVVALLGVGNKPTDYHEGDMEAVHRLADLAWHMAESKRVTRALEESEATNRASLQGIPDLVFMNRRDGEFLVVHASDPRLLFIPQEAFLHRKVQEVLPEPLAHRILAAFEDALDSRTMKELTYVLPLGDDEKSFEARVVPCTGDTVITIIRDITERQRAEEALRQNTARYQSLFNLASEGILVHTLDGKALEVNESFARMHGHTPKDMLQMNLGELNAPGTFRRHPERLKRILAGEVLTFEVEHVHKDGHSFPLEVLVSRISAGEMPVLLAFHRDITQRKWDEAERLKLEAQLQHAQKMESLGSLAGGVAHDMNNVLAAILGLASMHIEAQPPGSPVHRAFSTIIQASERGGNMLKSLLRFARQSPVESLALDLNTLIREEVRLLERTTLARVRLVMDLASDLQPMLGDASALSHAIMNLCVNAVDAMPDNGTLTLRTLNQGSEWVEVWVEDTGIGMTKGILEKAMDPFFTTKEVGKGTGLGLSIVYSTVKSHQGQMELKSEPGEGTQITLRFPAYAAQSQAPELLEETLSESPRAVRKVLLVDDDELIQSSMQTILQTLGHTVIVSLSGEEALSRIEAGFEPDVVILDLNMPGLGGTGTLARLRTKSPSLPVLLSTGRADQAALDLAKAYPFVTLLPKPFNIKELRQQLELLRHE
jgi:two-component system cell cycle sensor histidine kinase/response regulator CckA